MAESEINRARLSQEWRTLAEEVSGIAGRAKSFNTMATAILSLVAAVGTCKSGQPGPAAGKSSWIQKILSGARLASTIWLVFRSRGSTSEKK